MTFKIVTYRTLMGMKEIAQLPENKLGQFVVYKDKKPAYYVDCFDYENEANQIFNGLILARREKISSILNRVNKKHKTNLTIESAPLIEIEVSNGVKELTLKPFPSKWLN